jgi:hypothetical protein
MTPTRVDTDDAVVRIPADLDRPDRILGGLTARQLAILAAGGVAAWTLVRLLEPLAGLPAAAVLAAPLALATMALALGWRDGLPLDRLAVAGLGWWRQPRRLVVAPDGILPAPAWAGRPGPPLAPLEEPIRGLDPAGVVDLGGQGWALVCQATPVNLSLRTPPEQQALLAASPGSCTRWPAPCRCWSAATAPTSPSWWPGCGRRPRPCRILGWSRRRWPTPAGWRS